MLINVIVPPGLAAAIVGIPAIAASLLAHEKINWGLPILFVICAYFYAIIPTMLHMVTMELIYRKWANPKTVKAVIFSGISGSLSGLFIAFIVLLGLPIDSERGLLILFYSVLGLITGLGTGWIIKLFDSSQ